MKNTVGVILLGSVALLVGINLLRQRGATFNIRRYRLAIPDGRPVLEVYVEIFNPSDLAINLGDINLRVSFDNVLIGNIIPLKRYSLPGKKTSRIILPLNLTGSGAPLINSLLKAEIQQKPIKLTGSYTVGGMIQSINTEIRPTI